MKTINRLFLSFIATLFLLSCSNDTEGLISTQIHGDCFHHVYNMKSGTYKVYDAPEYVFELNYSDATADVEIKNVKFADGMPEISMKLEDLRWSIKNGFKTIDVNDVIPIVDGKEMPDYIINNIKIGILDRNIGAYYEPIINICFEINNMFKVTAVQKHILYMGKTSVSGVSSDAPFTTNTQIFQLTIDENLTAKLGIVGAKFAQGMPSLDMVFKNIIVEINAGTGYTLKSESLIPEISDVPYPNYEIVNLAGNGVFSTGLNLSFVCNIKKTSEAGVEMITSYTVNSNLGFDIPTE